MSASTTSLESVELRSGVTGITGCSLMTVTANREL